MLTMEILNEERSPMSQGHSEVLEYRAENGLGMSFWCKARPNGEGIWNSALTAQSFVQNRVLAGRFIILLGV